MINNCNICGERLTPRFREVRDPLTSEIFRIERCDRCGLGHTLPQPGELGRYYSAAYYGNRHGFTARHCSRRRLGFVNSAMGGRKPGRLLDIGCGDGSFLLEARRTGWQVMGTELNPAMARELGLDVKEHLGQIGDSERFDCITMWHTLEHMRDIPSTLKRAATLLDGKGRMVIAVPDWGGIQAMIFRERWLHLDVPRHLYHFDMGSLRSGLESAGLSLEQHWHHEFEYDLLGWSQSALNWLMPWPNLFFDALTGKRSGMGKAALAPLFALGVMLSISALPALALEIFLGRGGTLIAVAKKD
jgi:SAM-dependent methyltransferase